VVEVELQVIMDVQVKEELVVEMVEEETQDHSVVYQQQ
jgi:hypothetical protein